MINPKIQKLLFFRVNKNTNACVCGNVCVCVCACVCVYVLRATNLAPYRTSSIVVGCYGTLCKPLEKLFDLPLFTFPIILI